MWPINGDTQFVHRISWCLLSKRYSDGTSKVGILTRDGAVVRAGTVQELWRREIFRVACPLVLDCGRRYVA